MKNIFRAAGAGLLAILLVFGATSARAVPTLQLDILGGTYDSTTETIVSSGTSFSVFAYGQGSDFSLEDDYFVSMALLPQTSTAGSFGSFTFNGQTINVTGDMQYGSPPLESYVATTDPGDLAPHGVFETYFAERMFKFSASSQSGVYNTQDEAGSGPKSGTGMYYMQFDINISGLSPGYGIHFDLYNASLKKKCETGVCSDIDVSEFAPFSHDAQVTVIPEPEIYAMLGIGLGLMGFVARRRRNLNA